VGIVAVDWGTSGFRAWQLDDGGRTLARHAADRGILSVEGGAFEAVLRGQVGQWLDPRRCTGVLMSGMIGSRQGWHEAPYVPTPAGPAELSRGLASFALSDGLPAWIVPGISTRTASGVPDVMRGEETQILGILPTLDTGDHLLCLPGTHSKWVTVLDGRITGFATHMTGETFALFSKHSILARTMPADTGDFDAPAFEKGVRRSGEPGGLLHHAFGVRAEVLVDGLAEASTRDYLSGLFIGHECRAATAGRPVHLVGSAALTARYRHALSMLACPTTLHDPDAALTGLVHIARSRGLLT
jgi:2-dehydro-3-deoxygalactonokinase